MISAEDAALITGNLTLDSNISMDLSVDNLTGVAKNNVTVTQQCPELVEFSTTVLPKILLWIFIISLLFGVPGNLLVLLLAFRARRSSSLPYIISMAIFDLLVLLMSLMGNILVAYKLIFINLYIEVFVNACKVTNNWLLALLSIERCVAVCFPLRMRFLFGVRNVYFSVVGAIILSFAAYIPYWHVQAFKTVALYPMMISLWVLPGLVMTVCTSLVAWQLRKIQRHRRDIVSSAAQIQLSQGDSEFTRLLILTCVFYFVFHAPLFLSIAIYGDTADLSKWNYCISDNFLIETTVYGLSVQNCFFNNAINFYAYMFAAKGCRKQFVNLVLCKSQIT